MPDIMTRKKRSELMSKIRSKGTKIELSMRKALQENKIDFEYQPKMFGSPDFLVPPDIVVFCDSSFWHGRNWKRLRGELQEGYWINHIKQNRKRDRIVNKKLMESGYVILRFWDNQIEKQIDDCVKAIREAIRAKTHQSKATFNRGSSTR